MAGTKCPFAQGHVGSGNPDVNYGPNTRGGPQEKSRYLEPPLEIDDTVIDRHDHRSAADDYSQAGALFRLMTDDQQQQLANNIAGGLTQWPGSGAGCIKRTHCR